MLLPSALSCDSSLQQSRTRYQASLFASPPLSPPASSSHPTINNLYSTCRALQSMLTTPNQLPSPPTTHADPPSSPFKLKLRQRKPTDESTNGGVMQRRRISKRTQAQPPRGLNKRRRAADDGMSRDTEQSDDNDSEVDENNQPSTPKRMRLAPEVLPMGLERSDFHSLRLQQLTAEGSSDTVLESVEGMDDGSGNGEWNEEEDRVLVELVLTKLKLTKSDWQDCARSLGKDRGSVGKRWKSLMGAGEVGLKNRPRRSKIHSTWR